MIAAMDQLVQHAVEAAQTHGYLLLFAFVFAEQIGLPLPALPVLLAVGAFAGQGELSFTGALGAAVAASVLSDLCWYELGRHRGRSILNLLCRISLEPDSCVRNTEETFARRGASTLLYAKFVPGLNTAAPPLAGLFRLPLPRFLAWTTAGAAAWAGLLLGVGWVFSDQLEEVIEWAQRAGGAAVGLALGLLALYLLVKYLQRRRFLAELRIARITPEELQRRIAGGEEVVVVDLRHALETEVDPATLPGALRLTPEEIEARHGEIPRDREIVLYCT